MRIAHVYPHISKHRNHPRILGTLASPPIAICAFSHAMSCQAMPWQFHGQPRLCHDNAMGSQAMPWHSLSSPWHNCGKDVILCMICCGIIILTIFLVFYFFFFFFGDKISFSIWKNPMCITYRINGVHKIMTPTYCLASVACSRCIR